MAYLDNGLGQVVLVGTVDADTLDSTLSPVFVTLIGGAGSDTYIVDDFNFSIFELSTDPGTDTLRFHVSSASVFAPTNVENVVLDDGFTISLVTGNELNNVITGNSGNNTIDGGLGADTMNGGFGNDTYFVDNVGDKVNEAAGAGFDTVNSSITHTLAVNVEGLNLTGTANIDGTGNASDNTLIGNSGANKLVGLGGIDYIQGGFGNDTLDGGDGDDELDGGDGADTLLGGNGNDEMVGGAGADKMTGGAGNDSYEVDDAGDVVTEAAGGGDDTAYVVAALASYTLPVNVENVILAFGLGALAAIGNASNNYLQGNELNNTLDGGAGNDTIDGLGGADTMIGGTGNDTFVVDNGGDKVVEATDASGGVDTVISSINYTLPAGLENLVLAGSAQNGSGNDANNNIVGNGQDNTLRGYGGNDTLSDFGGADTMFGGPGNDTYYTSGGNDRPREFFNEGIDTIISFDFGINNLPENIENFELRGTMDNQSIRGNNLDNVLTGNSLANTLDGHHGFDTLNGGLGDDRYVVDQFVNGNPALSDKVVEPVNGGIDIVYSRAATYILPANVENLWLSQFALGGDGTGNALANVIDGNQGNNRLSGLDGDDTLRGHAGDDVLIGGNGNDLLDGSTGQDTMQGGAGNDTYRVDNVNDIVDEVGGTGTDTVLTRVSYSLNNAKAAGVENLTLLAAAAAAVTAEGNAANNVLLGNEFNNILTGLGGNDTLDGGLGADQMDGGAGNDSYVVDNAGDTIFEAVGGGTDLVTSSIDFDLNASLGGQQVENLTLTGAAITGLGNALANVITGNDGDNTIDGRGGLDTMKGGKGNDTYRMSQATDVVTELLNEGIDSVYLDFAPASFTLGANLEIVGANGLININITGNALGNFIFGTDGVNTLSGLDGNDVLEAGAGNDTLLGGNGDDWLDGDSPDDGGSNDTMTGGTGNDFYVVDSTGDIVNELAGQGTDSVVLELPSVIGAYTLPTNVENVYLTASATQTVLGNALNNIIYGNGHVGADNIGGGDGNDTIILRSWSIDLGPWAPLLAAIGDPTTFDMTGVRLSPDDLISGGPGNDRLEAVLNGFTPGAGAGLVQLVEDVLFIPVTAPSIVDLVSDVNGASRVTVTDPSAAPSSLTLQSVANGFDIGFQGFSQTLTANLLANTGADSLDIFVRGFTGTLTTPQVETLNFNFELSSFGHNFTLGSTAPDTFKFAGLAGNATIHGPFESDDTFVFGKFNATLTLDDPALDVMNVKLDDTIMTLNTGAASFSSFTVESVTAGMSNFVTFQITMDAGKAITLTGDGNLQAALFTDANGSTATGNLYLFAQVATGLKLTGGEGDDWVFGGNGNDVLNGREGLNYLRGNAGIDRFAFDQTPTGANISQIFDFTSGTDLVQLNRSNGAFGDLLAPVGGKVNPADYLIVDTLDLDSTTTAHVIFETFSGALYYNPTSADASDAVIFATVGATSGVTIVASEIEVI